MGIVLVLVLIPQLLLSQCANFGAFDIGEDVEITCADSCLTLVSPSIATVASGGAEYEVEEIEYDEQRDAQEKLITMSKALEEYFQQ